MAGLSTTRHLANSAVPPPQVHGWTEAIRLLIYEGNLHLPNWFISLSRHLELEFPLKAVVRSDGRIRCSPIEGLPVYTYLKADPSTLRHAVVRGGGSCDTMLLWFFRKNSPRRPFESLPSSSLAFLMHMSAWLFLFWGFCFLHLSCHPFDEQTRSSPFHALAAGNSASRGQ